jgi:hypothetical protein
MAALLAAATLAALAGCAGLGVPAAPSAATNRPDGEGYAGVGELLVRIGTQQEGSGLMESLVPRKRERAVVEIRYQGLDGAGRAVFERHDADALSESAPGGTLPTSAKGTILVPAAAAPESGNPTPAMAPNTRDIAIDLRLGRQLRVQGKIIEVIEATASGVVFRLY